MNDTLRIVLQVVGAIVLGLIALKIFQIVMIGVMLVFQLIFVVGVCAVAYWVLKMMMARR